MDGSSSSSSSSSRGGGQSAAGNRGGGYAGLFVPALLVLLAAYSLHHVTIGREQLPQRLDLDGVVQALRHVADELRAVAATVSAGPAAGLEADPSKLQFQAPFLKFAMVTDLDKASRDQEHFSWHALLRHGVLLPVPAATDGVRQTGPFRIEWTGITRLESQLAAKNRSMELSELVAFMGKLFAMCDITGLVFEVDPRRGSAFQRWVLADGDGWEPKPFKSEWATVKDRVLVVGSMGREWVDEKGVSQNFNSQWVKIIDQHGRVTSKNWRPVFEALRLATNTTPPGYLWHEAFVWDARLRRWLILPRKASVGHAYTPALDETRGTNLLLVASEDFSDIEVRRLGPLEPEWGFTALRKVPGTNDTYMALKVLEVGKETQTKITLFDLQGNFLLDPPFQVVENAKYEGLEFLQDQ